MRLSITATFLPAAMAWFFLPIIDSFLGRMDPHDHLDFGSDVVEPWEPSLGVAYEITGGLGTWAQVRFPETRYEVLVAEFGTYPPIQVLRALHFENRAHHHGRGPAHRSTRWAKGLLKEAFAPADHGWRDTVVPRGVAIVERALRALEAPQRAGASA